MNTYLFIGGPEIMIILLIVVMFFGSKRIPEIARGLAKGMKEVRNVTDDIKREINSSGNGVGEMAKDVKKGVDKVNEVTEDLGGSISRSLKKPFEPSKEDGTAPVESNPKITEKKDPAE